MKSRMKRIENPRWDLARILIYSTNIQVGCYGLDDAVEEALPFISCFIEVLNDIRFKAGYNGKQSELINSSGAYLYIVNLEGFSIPAAWLLVGILLSDNWKFGDISDKTESVLTATNPCYAETAQIMKIDMNRYKS